MFLQEQIAEVINSQQKFFRNQEIGVQREVVPNIQLTDSFAIILTGIRRCGKSTLQLQLMQRDEHDSLFLQFEDPRLAGFEPSDFNRLKLELDRRGIRTLFFDEIQIVKGWEIFVRNLLDEKYFVCITGSNASMLSAELGTKLTGRYLTAELFPFSFSEFCQLKQLEPEEPAAAQYLKQGGMPEYLKTSNGQILNLLLDDILVRDIAVRHGIRDVNSLKQLAVYLISNIGKPVSGKNLTTLFPIKATSTILEYFSYFNDSYLLHFVPQFSYSLKTQLRNPKKVYCNDMGIFTENSIVFSDENGRRLENLVYLSLRRIYKDIYYFKDKGECDFVAIRQGVVHELIQVCYELNDLNLKREVDGLVAAMQFFNVATGKIITLNQTDKIEQDGQIIEVMPLYKFLSNN
jgi:Predicted ATPase (AAA+ superfamily)